MTKNDLNNLKELVIGILETDPLSRDSDDRLYVKVCKAKNQDVINLPFEDIMLHRNEYSFPAYTSVERVRRKAQAERKDLVGTVKKQRHDLETEYVDFALSQ